MNLNKYPLLISQLNNSIKHNWNYVYISFNNFIIQVLKAFYKYGIIDGFFINKKLNRCCIFLKYYNNFSVISKFILYSKPGNYYFLSKKKLIHIMKKDPKSVFFISTSTNLIKGYRFIDFKYSQITGGLLLCSVRML